MKMMDIVKGNVARFSFYRTGELFYEIFDGNGKALYMFPVNIEDKKILAVPRSIRNTKPSH